MNGHNCLGSLVSAKCKGGQCIRHIGNYELAVTVSNKKAAFVAMEAASASASACLSYKNVPLVRIATQELLCL